MLFDFEISACNDDRVNVRAARPDLPIILATGYCGVMTEQSARELGFSQLMVKPVTASELAVAVHRALHPQS